MLSLARQKSLEQQIDIEWHEHDISDIKELNLVKEGEEGFDVITCGSALILLPDPVPAVKHWLSLFKPGGVLMTDIQSRNSNIVMSIFASIGEDVGESLKWDMNQFQRIEDLGTLVEGAGFKVEKLWESEVFRMEEIETRDGKGKVMFEEAVRSLMFAGFGKEGVKEKAKEAFVNRLKEIGGVERGVRQETRFWMCIARKPF